MRLPRSLTVYALALVLACVVGLGPIPPGLVSAATPVATPTPAIPAEVRLYATQVAPRLSDMTNAMLQVGQLMQSPDIADIGWQIDVAVQFVAMRNAHEELLGITPPAIMGDVHAQILSGSRDCYDSTEFATQGIDDFNVAKLQLAAELMSSCGQKMIVANAMLDDYRASVAAPVAAATPKATATPKVTATPKPTVKATAHVGATANRGANLRQGPGTTFKVVGNVKAGDPLAIIGKNTDGSWLKLKAGEWIAAFLVDGAPASLPVIK